jgi:hypothetical protein
MRKMIVASLFMMVVAFGASSNAAEDQGPNVAVDLVVDSPGVDRPGAGNANHMGVCNLSCEPCLIGSACPREPTTGSPQRCVSNCF